MSVRTFVSRKIFFYRYYLLKHIPAITLLCVCYYNILIRDHAHVEKCNIRGVFVTRTRRNYYSYRSIIITLPVSYENSGGIDNKIIYK